MKALFLSISLFILCNFLTAQNVVFHENFESPSASDSVSSSGSPAWTVNSTFYSDGSKSIVNQVQSTNPVYLVTNAFSTLGKNFVKLSFAHICKIEFFDSAKIELSIDNGTTWIPLTSNEYQGSGTFGVNGNRFSASTYPVEWDAANANTQPANSWWKNEIFELSTLAANKSQVKLRFKLSDGSSGVPGSGGAYGWLIDNIQVKASVTELNPPLIAFINSPQDTVWNTGPYEISAFVSDASGVANANLVYWINSGSSVSIPMIHLGGNNFSASIPSQSYLNTVNYYVQAIDNLGNSTQNPFNGKLSFYTKKGPLTVTIGNGTAQGFYMPMYRNTISSYKYSYHTAIYTKEEIGKAGVLSAIAYNKANNGSYPGTDGKLKIYLKHISSTSAPATYVDYQTALIGATLVYNTTTQTISANPGWVNFVFNTNNFVYNGDSNVQVFFEFYGSGVTSGAINWYYSNMPGMSYQFYGPLDPPNYATNLGSRPNIQLTYQSTSFANDAGIFKITQLSNVVLANTPINTQVYLKNYGTSALTKSTIQWKVDNTQKSNYLWTGNLAADMVSSPITIGSHTFAQGSHTLKSWTISPNDSTDLYPYNDTTILKLYACNSILNGTYTIGASGADFPNLNSAVEALKNCGVSGNVVFNIQPGIYTEQLVFGAMPGVGPFSTVTFQAANGDSSSVVIQWNTENGNNYVANFNACKYLNLNKLTLRSIGTTKGRVIEIGNGAQNNSVSNCVLQIPVGNLSTLSGIYAATGINSNNTILNNKILNGYYGIDFSGNSIDYSQNLLIEKNTIIGFSSAGIKVAYIENSNIKSNKIENGISSLAVSAIVSDNCKTLNFSKNKISISGQNISNGMLINALTGPALISNNFVALTSGTNGNGISISNSNTVDFVFNSINLEACGLTGKSLNISASPNSRMFNNIFVNTAGGYAAYIATAGNIIASNRNNYFTSNSNFVFWGTAANDLINLKNLSQQDTNSVSSAPNFNSSTDLHTLNQVCSNSAQTFVGITDDIDGELRSTSTPDIGADEFVLVGNDAGVVSLISPLHPNSNVLDTILVSVRNFGTSTINSLTINWKVNGITQTPFTYNQALQSQTIINLKIGTFNFQYGTNYTLQFYTSSPNGNSDLNNLNDSLLITNFKTKLPAGNYTIGGSSPNFVLPSDAANYMNAYGISGSVIFKIRDGVYNDQLSLNQILGASATSTITFKPETSANPTIQSGGEFTIKLNGADYINFDGSNNGTNSRNLTISNTSTSVNSAVIWMASQGIGNGSIRNSIKNCLVRGGGNSIQDLFGIYLAGTNISNSGAGADNDFNLFENNQIGKTWIGIYAKSNSSLAKTDSLIIRKNQIGNVALSESIGAEGIDLQNIDNSLITQNEIFNIENSLNQNTVGIQLLSDVNNTLISKNRISGLHQKAQTIGMATIGININNSSSNVQIVNNMISDLMVFASSSSSYPVGIRINGGVNHKVWFNSVNLSGSFYSSNSGNISSAFAVTNQYISGLDVRNNIFSNSISGQSGTKSYAISVLNATQFTNLNYNDYYVSGNQGVLGFKTTDITSLSNWKSSLGMDANSISVNPNFFNPTNLHTVNQSLNAVGTPISAVTDDFDGQLRNTTTPDLGADEFSLSSLDAGISDFVNKTSICPGSNTVQLRIFNSGITTMDSVRINWSVNGILQPAFYSHIVVAANHDTLVNIGNVNFANKTAYNLKFWSSNPNGATDGNIQNDSLIIHNFYPNLAAGNYSIGASSADFPSLTSAVNYLNQNGICGAVTFNIQSGNYNEQLILNEIKNASPSNTISFQSAANDSSSVTISFTPTSSIEGLTNTILLNGADYVTFKKVSISTGIANGGNGKGIGFTNGANFNRIENCRIISPISNSGTISGISNFGSVSNSNNTIQNNLISGGISGINWNVTSTLEKGNNFIGNTIQNFYSNGILISYQDSLNLSKNIISTLSNSSNLNGISANHCDSTLNISANKIDISGSVCNGILMSNCKASLSKSGIIANNFIAVKSSGSGNGLSVQNSTHQKIVFNSIQTQFNSTTNSNSFFVNGGSNLSIFNNVFSNLSNGIAYYISTPNSIESSDYNNFYFPLGNLAYWNGGISNLTLLKSSSGKDQHSINSNPKFYSFSNLHSTSSEINNAGTPLSYVSTDLDGESRNASNPDIGADEFSVPIYEPSILSFNLPTKSCGLDSIPVNITIYNSGTDTIKNNLTAGFRKKASTQVVSQNVTVSIPPLSSINFTFDTKAYVHANTDTTFEISAWVSHPSDPQKVNDTVVKNTFNGVIPASPTASGTSILYGATTQLHAISSDTALWYSSSISSNILYSGAWFTTPNLYNSTTYYVETRGNNLGAGCPSPRIPVIVTVTNTPASNVGISQIIVKEGCGLTNTETLKIKVYNIGSAIVNGGISAQFRIGNLAWSSSETIGNTINPGDTILYTFVNSANLKAIHDTTFAITAAIHLSGDILNTNDTLTKSGIVSKYTPDPPIITSPVNIPYSSPAMLSASSQDSILWYKSDTSTVYLAKGPTFKTPILSDTTTYWLNASAKASLKYDLSTVFVSGNNFAGNMFNITPNKDIIIDSFDVNVITGNNLIEVYYRPGTYVGNTASSAGWILVGSQLVAGNGTTVPTRVGIGGLHLSGNQTYGMYVTVNQTQTPDGKMYYSNAPGSASNIYSDANITLNLGNGGGYFNASTANRIWNGRIYYHFNIDGCEGTRIPVVIQPGLPNAIDAGISEIVNPSTNTTAYLSTPIQVKVKNYGTSTLNSCSITYSINGITKSTYNATGLNLSQGAVSAPITISLDSFPAGLYSIKAWTSNPNSTADLSNFNDTLSNNFTACLSGTYTLGATSSNFPTFADAMSALNSGGVCGNVVFKVAPGVYNTQLLFQNILGAGPNSTITFEAANGDSTSVTLQYAANAATDNYVVRMDNAKYIRFNKMTLKSTSTTAFARVVEILNNSNYNVFSNNVIISTSSNNLTANTVYIYSSCNYNKIVNNKLNLGYYSVYVYGASATSKSIGNEIIGNSITDFFLYGLYSYYQDSALFKNNNVNSSINGYCYAIYLGYCDRSKAIANNVQLGNSSYGYLIYLTYFGGTASEPGIVSNNFLTKINGSGTTYGIFNSFCTNLKVVYNSVNIADAGGASRGINQSNGAGQTFMNNNIACTLGSIPFYITTPTAVDTADYNNYFTTGSTLAFWNSNQADISSLKSASGKEANSISVNPNFPTLSNLHITNTNLDAKAFATAWEKYDYDGDLRDANTPDIGADEFVPSPFDAGIVSINSPNSPVSGSNTPIKVSLKNYGQITLVSATINWSINNVLQTPYSWTGTLSNFTQMDSIQIGTYTFPSGSYNLKVWTTNPNGQADVYNTNDTAYKMISSCSGPLKGTYTLGGSGAYFSTFNQAADALMNCGIDSNVVILVNSGTYNEQVSIGYIQGTNIGYFVTFKSLANDSNAVILSYNSQVNNYVLQLNGARNVIFKGITIEALNSTLGYAVVVNGNSSLITFSNNVIKCPANSNQTCVPVFSPGGSIDYRIAIINNRIVNGYYGVYFNGISQTLKEDSNVVEGNTITNVYYSAVYGFYQSNFIVRKNIISNVASAPSIYAVYPSYCSGNLDISANKISVNATTNSYGLYLNVCDGNGFARIFNNFISITNGTSSSIGINTYSCDGISYYFNNINVTSGGANARGIYLGGGSGINVKNNNLVVTSAGGSALYTSSNPGINSDYNNFYAPSGFLVNNYSTLTNWQSTSFLDSNSISGNPLYVSTTNLHTSGIAINGKGTPIPYLDIDIDGETRNSQTPDIGADEFTPQGKDLALISLISPTTNVFPVGNSANISVSMTNYGSDPITSANIKYAYGTASPVIVAWTGSLTTGLTTNYTFTAPLNVILGKNQLNIWVELTNDQDNTNDSIKTYLYGLPTVNANFADSFDVTLTNFIATGNQNLWQLGVPTATIINSAHSAPNAWVTNLTGQYPNNATEYLYSPYFNFSGVNGATLKFWHWYQTASNDYGTIQYSKNFGQNWSTLGYMTDPLGTNWFNTNVGGTHAWSGNSGGWVQSQYNLAQFDTCSSPVQFRFAFVSNATVTGEGWAIDNFEIDIPPLYVDAKMDSILSPKGSMSIGSQDSVIIRIKNNGTNTLTSIPVYYQINNGTMVNGLWTGSLLAGDTAIYTFTTPLTAPSGSSFKLSVYVNAAGDLFNFNDSLVETILTTTPHLDAGILRFSIFNSYLNNFDTLCNVQYYPVKVWIKNFGLDTLHSIDLQYIFNAGTPKVGTWSGTLISLDSVLYTFPDQIYYSQFGNVQICGKTLLVGDAISSNDEKCRFYNVAICSGFENIWQTNFTLLQNTPNPAEGNTQINFEIPISGKVKFQLTNMLGQMLESQEKEFSSGRNSINLDVAKLPAGIYYYSIEMEGRRLVKKMVVE